MCQLHLCCAPVYDAAVVSLLVARRAPGERMIRCAESSQHKGAESRAAAAAEVAAAAVAAYLCIDFLHYLLVGPLGALQVAELLDHSPQIREGVLHAQQQPVGEVSTPAQYHQLGRKQAIKQARDVGNS